MLAIKVGIRNVTFFQCRFLSRKEINKLIFYPAVFPRQGEHGKRVFLFQFVKALPELSEHLHVFVFFAFFFVNDLLRSLADKLFI